MLLPRRATQTDICRSKIKYLNVLFVLRHCRHDKLLYYFNIPWKYLIIYSRMPNNNITNKKKHIKNVTLPTVYTNVAAIIE